jgi:ADP-ribose pyrophosphatase
MPEEIIKSEYLFRGKILNVRLDDVRLADARSPRLVKREIIEHQGAVAIVAIDAQDQVLLVRQFRSAAQQEMLEIPAGTLERGEDPSACAVRELREETGFFANQWNDIGTIYSSPGYSTEKIWLYQASNLTAAESALEDDESIEVVLVPLDEAIAMIEEGTINDAKSIVGLLRVLKKSFESKR